MIRRKVETYNGIIWKILIMDYNFLMKVTWVIKVWCSFYADKWKQWAKQFVEDIVPLVKQSCSNIEIYVLTNWK